MGKHFFANPSLLSFCRPENLDGSFHATEAIYPLKNLRGFRWNRRQHAAGGETLALSVAQDQEARVAEWRVLKKKSDVAQVTEQVKTNQLEAAELPPQGLEQLTLSSIAEDQFFQPHTSCNLPFKLMRRTWSSFLHISDRQDIVYRFNAIHLIGNFNGFGFLVRRIDCAA